MSNRPRQIRREQAEVRQAHHAALATEEQVAALNGRLGEDHGACKERAVLFLALEEGR